MLVQTHRPCINCLTTSPASNNLLNKFQSAYTLNIIQLRLHFLLFMTTSSKLCLKNKSRLYLLDLSAAFVSLPSIILFSCFAYQFGLDSMAGSHHICHRVGSWSLSTQLLLLSLLSVVLSHKDQSSVLFYLFSIHYSSQFSHI